METVTNVVEYKCPCCNAGLTFRGDSQQLKCDYCDNSFDLDTVKAFNESQAEAQKEEIQWEQEERKQWPQEEQQQLRAFQCPSCGGEILCQETTAASFCPYCDNPTILPSRLQGSIKPDAVIPFRKTREDAKEAFLQLCKKKPLLPKFFTQQQRLEKITGMYVPFWLYDCEGDFQGSYKATRIHTWSSGDYDYIKTDHYLLKRSAQAEFVGIPMDGSSAMDDTFMESIEPYDYSQLTEFDMAYLTGFLADKYDVESEKGEARIKERVDTAMNAQLQNSLSGYSTVLPENRQLTLKHSKARYVLMPVWMLSTRYKDKVYTFAMNGQTGKMTGSFPICPKRSAMWFFGLTAGMTAVLTFLQWLILM